MYINQSQNWLYSLVICFSHLEVSSIIIIINLCLIVGAYNEGEQMILPFNQMNVDISCLGNHELDMGLDQGKHLVS